MVNNCLPDYFLGFLQRRTHSYSTRNKNFQIPKTKHKYAESRLRNQLPVLLNKNENYILDKVNTHSEVGFCIYVKKHLISQYSGTCSVRDCFVCSAN